MLLYSNVLFLLSHPVERSGAGAGGAVQRLPVAHAHASEGEARMAAAAAATATSSGSNNNRRVEWRSGGGAKEVQLNQRFMGC